ncbi:MAG: dual specificity protein phosphatase family protein [Pontiella sp.]
MFLFGKKEETCVQIPLEVKGKLYCSPMPFGPYDSCNGLLKIYKKNRIKFAVMLVTDVELAKKAKRDVIKIYKENGIQPIRFPIADYTSPELHDFSVVVDRVSNLLRTGAHVAVHCNAGVGRTSVMTSCIAQDLLKLSAQEAISHVKHYMQTNMTDEQIRLVKRFQPLEERLQSPKEERVPGATETGVES